MFRDLYQKPSAIERHENAPYADERIRYLRHCADRGYSRATLLFRARELLWVARKLSVYPTLDLTVVQVEDVANDWHEREQHYGRPLDASWTRGRFVETAQLWLRFLGYLQCPPEHTPFTTQLEDYATWMAKERGLADTTIESRVGYARQFLRWYGVSDRSLDAVEPSDVDRFLAEGHAAGWCRVTSHNVAGSLRSFFRYIAMRGWCSPRVASSIRGPRIFSLATLPLGPDWPDVQRLIAHLDTDHPHNVRNRAVMMLLAIYGLRASEVANLRLEHIDWKHDELHVHRAKRGSMQVYPLIAVVGNAVARYLEQVRPSCSHSALFLSLLPPVRPLTRASIYDMTRRTFDAVGIDCVHKGPHALRHACAAHLVTQGMSLKAIGDHLGHRSTSATRIYAKVDLGALREVAAFDVGGLL